MSKLRLLVIGISLWLLAVSGLGAAALSNLSKQPADAAASQAPSVAAVTQQSGTSDSTETQVENAFMANFTAQLGIDQSRLDSAFKQAVNQTVDQAVTSGALTQADANQAKALAESKGFRAIFSIANSGSKADSGGAVRIIAPDSSDLQGAAALATLNSLAALFNVNSKQLMASLISNDQSLAGYAQAHNVTVQAMKDAILQAVRSAVNNGAASGTWTQSQADAAYNDFSQKVDSLINGKGQEGLPSLFNGPADAGRDRLNTAAVAGLNAAANLMGMDPAQLGMDVKANGQTLASIAQAHHVDIPTLKTTMLNAARSALNDGLAKGTWTQAQADETYNTFAQSIDSFINGNGSPQGK